MSISKPIGAGLSLGSLAFPIGGRHLMDSGASAPEPLPVNLAPAPLDFTQWVNQPMSPMDSTDGNTFTNGGTGYIHFDIGAEAGKQYRIEIEQTRGPGTLLIYLAANDNVTQADQVYGLEGGSETVFLTADGPWFTFRASVGATTTTVTKLQVFEV